MIILRGRDYPGLGPRRLKVLVLAYRFLPEVGGYETLVNEISKRLADWNIDVVVVCFTTRPDLPQNERIGNVRILRLLARPSRLLGIQEKIEPKFARLVDRVLRHRSDVGKPLSLLTQLFVHNDTYVPSLSANLLGRLIGAITTEQPDLVHVFDPRTAVALYPVALLTRSSVVVTFPGTFWTRSLRERSYDKLCYCLNYGWYVMHEDGTGAASKARMMGVNRVSSFFSGVDKALFNPRNVSRRESRGAFGIDENSFVFGVLGRIESIKGVREVVASFLNVAGKGDVLLVAGEISDRRYNDGIIRLIAESQNGRLVRFTGPIEHSRVPVFLAACDVVIFNSRLSNFHLTFAETLMMGRPCVVGLRGMGEAKGSLSGCPTIFFHDGTVPGLDAALRVAKAQGPNEEFSESENSLAGSLFDWEVALREITRSYETVLSHGSTPNGPES